ncbi:hypothetical protein CB0940_12263 [Cercospora beticola]|uniref:Uncharacterized protein n=1 Tax=Cercospora beticola TaxID=122368 RepID=A0A2G5H416_CERBT|nr:hypothetical protein CB0940_12263 [Cercospora beticola]PIA87298.1 hypothetical protein CB0940_12263 [Cercospora beticola]
MRSRSILVALTALACIQRELSKMLILFPRIATSSEATSAIHRYSSISSSVLQSLLLPSSDVAASSRPRLCLLLLTYPRALILPDLQNHAPSSTLLPAFSIKNMSTKFELNGKREGRNVGQPQTFLNALVSARGGLKAANWGLLVILLEKATAETLLSSACYADDNDPVAAIAACLLLTTVFAAAAAVDLAVRA